MPKLLPLIDFAKSGLNSDLMPWDLPGSFLTEISNIRISRQKLSPFGGSVAWDSMPIDFNPGFLIHVNSSTGTFWLVAGDDGVLAYDGATFEDISSTVGYAGVTDVDKWNGCLLTNIPIINNPGHYPEYWSPQNTATILKPLPWDATTTWVQANQSATIIRSHKQWLFAMDLISNGTEIADGVRWSTPADISGIPETWDELDVTSTAGLTFLGGDGGRIIDGKSLRDAFVVYRESGVSVFDYVGGQFVWQVRHLSTTVGLLSDNCVVEVKGKHYFIGDGDILVNDGNSIQSLLHNRIRQRFVSNIDADNFTNSYAVENDSAKEVWFCVPEEGREYPNVAYIYNWEDDTWSVRQIPEAPMGSYGPQAVQQATWESLTQSWNSSIAIWSQRNATPRNDTVVIATRPAEAGQSGQLLVLDSGTESSETVFSSTIERLGFALEGLSRVTTITRLYPHMRGPGTVYIQIGSQDFPSAPVRWKEAVLFNPVTDRKVDIRTTGELHCFKIYSVDDSTYWEFSGMDVEYVDSGAR